MATWLRRHWDLACQRRDTYLLYTGVIFDEAAGKPSSSRAESRSLKERCILGCLSGLDCGCRHVPCPVPFAKEISVNNPSKGVCVVMDVWASSGVRHPSEDVAGGGGGVRCQESGFRLRPHARIARCSMLERKSFVIVDGFSWATMSISTSVFWRRRHRRNLPCFLCRHISYRHCVGRSSSLLAGGRGRGGPVVRIGGWG